MPTTSNGDCCVELMSGALVRPVPRFPQSIAGDDPLKVASNRVRTTLARNAGTGDTLLTVGDASRIVPQMLLTIDNEIVSVSSISGNVLTVIRGFDGTHPACHSAGSVLNANIVAWHHNVLAAEITAIETALSQSSLIPSVIVSCPTYNFPQQTPGGTLAAGNQVITLAPVPKGVNGTDKNHYLYISGGTGTAEAVLITGGTAVSGAASGTVIVTCANSHSGAWTIKSASGGIFEAYIANPWRKLYMPAGQYMMYAPLNFDWAQTLGLIGDGYDWANNVGTMLHFGALTTNTPAISLNNASGVGTLNVVRFQDFGISGTFTPSGGDGIFLRDANRVCISGVQVIGFAGNGIHALNCLELCIQDQCNIMYSGQWGINITGNSLSGFNVLRDIYVNWNGRADNGGNIILLGTTPSQPMGQHTLMNVDCEQAGQQPFTGVTITSAQALAAGVLTHLCVMNSDFEVGMGPFLVNYGAFGTTIDNLTEFNNAYVGNQISYAPTVKNVRSWGNMYYGAACYRVFQGPDRTNYDIGPDAAGAGSPEPADRRMLGLPGTTGAGSALLGANSPATVLTAPYTWLKMQGPDGTPLFIPAWK